MAAYTSSRGGREDPLAVVGKRCADMQQEYKWLAHR